MGFESGGQIMLPPSVPKLIADRFLLVKYMFSLQAREKTRTKAEKYHQITKNVGKSINKINNTPRIKQS